MALAKGLLINDMIDILGGDDNPVSSVVASNIAKSVIAYWETGQSDKGGMVTATASKPLLTAELTTAFAAPVPVSAITATKIATAFINSFLLITIAGGAHGTGSALVPSPGITLEMIDLFSKESPTRVMFAKKFAEAIHNFTTTSTIWGTGIPPSFVAPGSFLV